MSKKRLFIAIGLPESLKSELEALQKNLKRFARDAKWVNVKGIHLTLKFLGYVEPENISSIQESLGKITQGSASVEIRAQGCGFFPNARRPNVLWVGVDAPQLLPLQIRVESAMESLGFEKENRAFSPHLTLARFKDNRGLLPLAHEVEQFTGKQFREFTANSFSLYESILRPQGAEYHILHRFLFTEGSKGSEEL